MKPGPASFLTSRPAEEAFETVKELYVAEGFVLRKVARRVGVTRGTLYRWLKANPGYDEQLEAMRAKALEEKTKES